MTNFFDILAVGNAIVDYLVRVDDAFLQEFKIEKSSYGLVNEAISDSFIAKLPETYKVSAGGAAANTVAAISSLGGSSAFVGCVKDDPIGEIFNNSMTKVGVALEYQSLSTIPGTGRSIIMITPDAARTMRTYLGASIYVTPAILPVESIKRSKILMLEGYFFDPENAFNTNIEAAKIAKTAGNKVVLAASDKFCVDRNYPKFAPFIKEYVDIYIANSVEAMATAKAETVAESISYLRDMVDILVITMGPKGSVVVQNGVESFVPPDRVSNIIDSTGAGDLYAAGILFGQAKGLDIVKSARLGSICAGSIIQQIGARPDKQIRDLAAFL